MVQPVTGHPAADRATGEALVVEQDRAIVPMSNWLADAAVTAVSTGRSFQVLTPAESQITFPLELLLLDSGGQWVVRAGTERFRDGFTGGALRWDGARFVPDEQVRVATPDIPRPGSGDLDVQVTTLHPAGGPPELGRSAETVIQALTGGDPLGWGAAEPVTEPWSLSDAAAWLGRHLPAQLVVVGVHTVGQVALAAGPLGIVERSRFSGPRASAVRLDAIDALAATVAGTDGPPARATIRSMIVAAHPGRLDGLRGAVPTPPALPLGILLGGSVIAERGVDNARAAPAGRITLLGDTEPACWCRLDAGPGQPYEVLTAILQHFGQSTRSQSDAE